MTKNEMAKSILESSSAKNVSENRFYKNVAKQSKTGLNVLIIWLCFQLQKKKNRKTLIL